MLDVIATDKGFLAPRVALLANNNSTLPIASPTSGLLVYNTTTAGSSPNNVTPGYYYWDGTVSLWQKISAGNALGFIQNQNSADQTANWRITGTGQWGGATSKGSLSIDQGSSIELGGTGSPYIDIANATGDDFDARIQLTGDDYLSISGANLGVGNTAPAHQLSVGAATADGQAVTIRGYSNSPASWKGGGAFGYTSAAVIMGELSGVAQLGGHNGTLGAWANLAINSAGGNVGVGISAPLGKLDVQGAVVRTGTHATSPSFYVTGSMNPGQTGPAAGNVEFRHDNGTQGIGFGYNTIYQTGSNTNQELNLLSRGSSHITLNAFAYSTGNVGVGLTGPTEKLEVSGAIKMPGASATDNNSPALTLVSDDDFLYDAEYINHYAFGFHNFNDGAGLGANSYISGYYGIDLFTGGTQRFRINNNGTVKINNLAGTGTRVVVADASGNISATTSIGTGIVSGNGTQNYVTKWNNAAGTTIGNSAISDNGNIIVVSPPTYTHFNTGTVYVENSLIARGGITDDGGDVEIIDNLRISNAVTGIGGYFPTNNAIRLTPNLHLNATQNNAVILNWDNGATGTGTQMLRIGNGAGADMFGVLANGDVTIQNKVALRGNDSWLRLNQDAGFTTGTYTPGFFRVDGGIASGGVGSLGGGTIHATSYTRTTYLSDYDDTGYYLDPNSTSNSALRIRGGALHGPNPSWGAYLLVGGDGRNGYIDNGSTASVSTTNGNLHMDAASGYDMYLNYYDGNNIHFGRGNNSIRATLDGNGLYLYDGWLRTYGGNGLYFQDYGTGIRGVQADGGSYGSVSTYGALGGWNGYSLAGRYVLMSDGAQNCGLYNDVDNYWYMLINRLATDNGFQFMNSYTGALNLRFQHTNGTRYASYDGDSNWDFYSDRRLKEHIENEENILDRLLKLDVVNYHFIDECKEEKEIGFIAQDVEQYFPSLVSEATDDRYDFKVKTLGYSSFGVLAVGAIKELKFEKDEEIAGLNKTITELKQEIESLKTENESIKAQFKADIGMIKAALNSNNILIQSASTK
jgi:hypothetical protein